MNTYGRGPVPWEGTISRVRKNGYVPLGTYQNINFKNFEGGPVQYFKKIPYSNFLGRTSKKKHPVEQSIIASMPGVGYSSISVMTKMPVMLELTQALRV